MSTWEDEEERAPEAPWDAERVALDEAVDGGRYAGPADRPLDHLTVAPAREG